VADLEPARVELEGAEERHYPQAPYGSERREGSGSRGRHGDDARQALDVVCRRSVVPDGRFGSGLGDLPGGVAPVGANRRRARERLRVAGSLPPRKRRRSQATLDRRFTRCLGRCQDFARELSAPKTLPNCSECFSKGLLRLELAIDHQAEVGWSVSVAPAAPASPIDDLLGFL